MINYSEALDLIKYNINSSKKDTEQIGLLDCLGRISAVDVFSNSDFPRFDNSAMDGIAIIYDENIKSWNLDNEISAGNFIELNSSKENCIAIMTGAKVPQIFDTVIPIEDLFFK